MRRILSSSGRWVTLIFLIACALTVSSSAAASASSEREKAEAFDVALLEAEAETLSQQIASEKAKAPPAQVEQSAPKEVAMDAAAREQGPYELAPYVAPQAGSTAKELFEAEGTFNTQAAHRPQNWLEEKDDQIQRMFHDNPYVEMRGEYRASYADDHGSPKWAFADSELKGDNFRFFADTRKQNTFDTEAYSSLHLKLDTHFPSPVNIYSEMWFYPWAYRGTTNTVTYTGAFGDQAEIRLKYMGNRPAVNNETYRTTLGFALSVPDVPVNHLTVDQTTLLGDFGNTFPIDSLELDTAFQPFRNLWATVANPDKTVELRIIPYMSQEHAIESDDPMGLIGHHIYWEPSPWLSFWDTNVTGQRFRRRWILDETDDSSFQRLRLLRGFGFKGEWGDTSLESLVTSSLGPWDNYSDYNVFPWAVRLKQDFPRALIPGLIEEGYAGVLWSMRTARREDDIDANNWAYGIDGGVTLPWQTDWKGEIAYSRFEENLTSTTGFARRIGGLALKSVFHRAFEISDRGPWAGPVDAEFTTAHFDRDFNPPLATYDETAKDQLWGKNIYWEDRKETDMTIRIGDSITSNRNVYGVNLRARLWDDRVIPYVNFRHARSETENKFLQSVFRTELAVKVTPKLTSKFLYIYEDRPRLGLPDVQTQQNYKILGPAPETLVLFDTDAQHQGDILTTWSTGARYDFTDRLYMQSSIKRTNEYPRWPQAGTLFATINPSGFEQYFVYRGRIGWTPFLNAHNAKRVGLAYEWIHNDFKHASSIDDNINMHDFEAEWDVSPKVSLTTIYRIAEPYDTVDDARFEHTSDHRRRHNVFFNSVYRLNANRRLTISFGELGAYREGQGFFHSVLDTQHVLRVTLTGEF